MLGILDFTDAFIEALEDLRKDTDDLIEKIKNDNFLTTLPEDLARRRFNQVLKRVDRVNELLRLYKLAKQRPPKEKK